MKNKNFVSKVKGPFRSKVDGINYMTYRWKGHEITFLEEDVEVYQWYMCNGLELAIPCYVHQEYRGRDEYELTDKEVKNAVLLGMSDELWMCGTRIEEQPEGRQADLSLKYNEEVGIFHFRTPQGLTDEETAWQHKNKYCILQRYGEGQPPKVVCYAKSEKYVERLRRLYEKYYLGKGYDLFFHNGNGDGVYTKYKDDDKSVLAEYQKDGIYYYNEPQSVNWLWYLLEKADCYCVVQGGPEFDVKNKIVCYATEPCYNEQVREVYAAKYRGKGYFLLEHCRDA